ncbi:MAG: hypothetical protein ILP18_09085 [Treponema sp.]|nr:hypothetical protein [Treponema sp.]
MSHEAYNAFATTVRDEMQRLDYEEQLGILTIVVTAMNDRKKQAPAMSREEKLKLFNELNGCIKATENIDARKEYLEYLDERYGV